MLEKSSPWPYFLGQTCRTGTENLPYFSSYFVHSSERLPAEHKLLSGGWPMPPARSGGNFSVWRECKRGLGQQQGNFDSFGFHFQTPKNVVPL
jgi:hypothetical protein